MSCTDWPRPRFGLWKVRNEGTQDTMMPEWERKALAKDIAEAQTEEKAKGCSSCLWIVGVIAVAFLLLGILIVICAKAAKY